MTKLNVLTGLHAGASMEIGPGSYRVSNEISCDDSAKNANLSIITILDWSEECLDFRVDPNGVVKIIDVDQFVRQESEHGWGLDNPIYFGQIGLRICDSENENAELDSCAMGIKGGSLLNQESCHASGPILPDRVVKTFWKARALGVATGLIIAMSAWYGHGSADPVIKTKPRLLADPERLSANFSGRGLNELQVRREDNSVVVSGLVRNADEGRAVRLATAEFSRGSEADIIHRWEIADEIAASIDAALRSPRVHASYQGGGRFLVQGTVSNPDDFQADAEPLRKDLGSNVRAMDFLLNSQNVPVPISAAIAAGILHYSERPDGAKVFKPGTRGT